MKPLSLLLRGVARLLKTAALIGSVLLAFALWQAPAWMGHQDTPGVADYIVPFGGEAHRAVHAANLFNRGYADRVLVGRPAASGEVQLLERYGIANTRAELVYHYVMTADGVPPGAIRFFGNGLTNAHDEVQALFSLIGAGPGRIIVITSPYRLFRTRLMLREYAPEWSIMVIAAPQESFQKSWWTSPQSVRHVLLETAQICSYLLDRLVRFARSLRPGSSGGI